MKNVKHILKKLSKVKEFQLLTFVLLFLVSPSSIEAQVNSPEVKCLAVDAVGDVTVTWLPAADPLNIFIEYRIYADNGGGFVLVGTEPALGVGSFVHAGANANVNAFQYVVTSFSTSESVQQDTLSTILMSVNNPGDGTSVLIWNPMSIPKLTTASNWYMIYLEYPVGVWTLIDSTEYGNEYYRDTITICNGFLSYKIELSDNSGCVSVSNIDGGQFQDGIPPTVPEFNWVSADTATGDALLSWSPSTSIDAVGYVVSEFISGGWIVIDSVLGFNNTTYVNTNAFVNYQSENYSIAAYDSCGNTSPLNVPQNTIFVTTTLNVCETEIALNWNAYQNWNGGVLRYEVYASNGGAFSLIATLAGTTTSYLHTGVTGNLTYCYVIKAVSVSGTVSSLSNKACRFVRQPPLPQFAYLQTATVINDTEIEVRFHPDVSAIINSYTLERTDDLANPFELISVSPGGTDPIVFNDYDVLPESQNYYYRVLLEDSCGRSSLTSNVGKTILLTVSENKTTLVNLLQWSKYESWDGNIIEYRVYRSVNGVYDTSPIASVSANQSYYQDNVEGMITNKVSGEFCYYVEAVEDLNTYGIAETSLSNSACAKQNSIVYVPNGLYIGGVNNTWKPVVNLLDFSSYEVRVFGRRGHMVFKSNDANQAWDGNYNGKLVQIGVYVYQITFLDSDGKHQEVSGHITVVR